MVPRRRLAGRELVGFAVRVRVLAVIGRISPCLDAHDTAGDVLAALRRANDIVGARTTDH